MSAARESAHGAAANFVRPKIQYAGTATYGTETSETIHAMVPCAVRVSMTALSAVSNPAASQMKKSVERNMRGRAMPCGGV